MSDLGKPPGIERATLAMCRDAVDELHRAIGAMNFAIKTGVQATPNQWQRLANVEVMMQTVLMSVDALLHHAMHGAAAEGLATPAIKGPNG